MLNRILPWDSDILTKLTDILTLIGSVLAKEKYLIPRRICEAIEIGYHSNFNRNSEWLVPPGRKTVLGTASVVSVHETLESGVVSIVCNDPFDIDRNVVSEGICSPPPFAFAPKLSDRAAKALACSFRR